MSILDGAFKPIAVVESDCRAPAAEPHREPVLQHDLARRVEVEEAADDLYVFSNFCFYFWLIFFGKLYWIRSRLYRSQILEADTRLKALDEIYKIYTYAHFCTFLIPMNPI